MKELLHTLSSTPAMGDRPVNNNVDAYTSLPTQEPLSAESFMTFLSSSLDSYCDGDPAILEHMWLFAAYTPIEFIEPATPEDKFSKYADRIEMKISSFVEHNEPVSTYQLLDLPILAEICEIYNPNNLLAFAKDLASRSPNGFDLGEGDMVYRYRTALRCLEERKREILLLDASLSEANQAIPKVGARTWAGNLHPYGFTVGLIEPEEYNHFSSEQEDPGHRVVTVDGVEYKMDGRHEPITAK